MKSADFSIPLPTTQQRRTVAHPTVRRCFIIRYYSYLPSIQLPTACLTRSRSSARLALLKRSSVPTK